MRTGDDGEHDEERGDELPDLALNPSSWLCLDAVDVEDRQVPGCRDQRQHGVTCYGETELHEVDGECLHGWDRVWTDDRQHKRRERPRRQTWLLMLSLSPQLAEKNGSDTGVCGVAHQKKQICRFDAVRSGLLCRSQRTAGTSPNYSWYAATIFGGIAGIPVVRSVLCDVRIAWNLGRSRRTETSTGAI